MNVIHIVGIVAFWLFWLIGAVITIDNAIRHGIKTALEMIIIFLCLFVLGALVTGFPHYTL